MPLLKYALKTQEMITSHHITSRDRTAPESIYQANVSVIQGFIHAEKLSGDYK